MLQWCCKSFKIRKYFHFEDGDLFHCYRLVPNQYHLDQQWLILTNDRRIHSQNYFFFSKLLQHHYSTLTNDWDNEWKICPSSKWNYFFLFRNYYQLQHHFSTLTNDWYNEAWIIDISILKMIFFFILKLLQHHSSAFTNDWYDEWKICPSSKWNYFFISKLLQHHSSTLTNDWYNEW